MKQLLYFLPFLLLSLGACQENEKPQNTSPGEPVQAVDGPYNNRFFSLDLTDGPMDMDTFKQHFFTNFPHNDPTQGTVVYDQSRWMHDDLFEMKENNGLRAHLRYRDDSTGFDSYRLTTKAYYNLDETTQKILFVFKGRFPTANGMWPAWWLNGSMNKEWLYQDSIPAMTDEMLYKYSGKGLSYVTSSSVNNIDWPGAGEIDIIENINGQNLIHNTLHTCPNMCDSEWNGDGKIINCANTGPWDINPGCSGSTYKIDELEGTFACVWEKAKIRFYYWTPDSEVQAGNGPLSENPDPESWTGTVLKNTVKLLETDAVCNSKIHQDWQCKNCAQSNSCQFLNMKMIFNVTLCGNWAGSNFDDSNNAWDNCRDFIVGEGRNAIDNSFMTIEYVSVQGL